MIAPATTPSIGLRTVALDHLAELRRTHMGLREHIGIGIDVENETRRTIGHLHRAFATAGRVLVLYSQVLRDLGVVPESVERLSSDERRRYGQDRYGPLIEAESLYLAQRDRIDGLITKEQRAGSTDWTLDREILTGGTLINHHGLIESNLRIAKVGAAPRREAHAAMSRYAVETARSLDRPPARAVMEWLNKMLEERALVPPL